MDTSKHLIAGVDIGGTKTATVLSRELPLVLARSVFATKPELGPQHAIEQIISSLEEQLRAHGASAADLAAIGVSCGSPLDSARGVVQAPPNLPTWVDVPVTDILTRHFGVRCFLENDANAGALAEFRFGAGKGTENFIFLTMGTGFGAGLILNGRIYQGSSYSAGEIGHVRLSHDGPEGYGKVGSVEGWASGAGMAKVAIAAVEQAAAKKPTLLGSVLAATATLSARDVAEASARGDEVAADVVKQVGCKLGETLAILVDILDPECIAIGGLALRFGEQLLGPARAVMNKEALAVPGRICRVVPAGLGEQIGDIAALSIAFNALAQTDARPGAKLPASVAHTGSDGVRP